MSKMIPPSSKIKPSSSTSSLSNSSNIFGLNMVGGASRNNNNISNGSSNKDQLLWHQKVNRMIASNDAASKALGPLAIVGGTVSIYTAALSHSSTTLTPLSVLYLFLLALNYSIMPRISKKYVSPKTNKESVALVEEVVKMSMGIGGFLLTECSMNSNGGMSMHNLMTSIQEATSNWSIHSSLLAAGLPSALYAIQGVLTYTSYQNLDSVTFNGITQIKTLSAALCCYLVLGKVQSKIQILALALLSLSTLVFQGMLDIRWYVNGKEKRAQRKQLELDRNKEGSRSGGVGTSIGGGIGTGIDVKKRFIFGIVPCLAATLLSGLAGAFSQRSLQTVVGSMERNAYFYSAEISFISAVCLLFSMATKRIIALRSRFSSSPSSMKSKTASVEVTKVTKSGYFDHWTWQTFVPIIVKATGGILTALVHKHSGSVMKGFSLVLGLVFSALLQTVLDGKDLTLGQIVGTALVLLSSWLHFTNPSS